MIYDPYTHFSFSIKKPSKAKCGDASYSGLIKNNGAEFYLLLVADGVSKAPKDYLASETTINSIVFHLENEPITALKEDFQKAILYANQQIYLGVENTIGMLSTLSALIYDVKNAKIYLANIGDSRIFGFNGEQWLQLTKDDADRMPYMQNGKQVFQNGELIFYHPLTKAIGGTGTLEFEIIEPNFNEYMGFAMASDGFYDLKNFTDRLHVLYHAITPLDILQKQSEQLLSEITDDASIGMIRLPPDKTIKFDYLTKTPKHSLAFYKADIFHDLDLAANSLNYFAIENIIKFIIERQIIDNKADMVQLLEKMIAIKAKGAIGLLTAILRKI